MINDKKAEEFLGIYLIKQCKSDKPRIILDLMLGMTAPECVEKYGHSKQYINQIKKEYKTVIDGWILYSK